MIFSKLNAARIAYGVDRAIAATGALWENAVASHPTWLQYVTNYVQRGTIPSLGSATRNNAFVAVMTVAKPGISPGQGANTAHLIASILIESTHNAVHTDAPFTIAATCKDADGNTIASPTLHWLSSVPAKGTIGATTGVFTPVAAGVTNVTVSVAANGLQPAVTSNTDVVTLS
jgi:hypothetical protein